MGSNIDEFQKVASEGGDRKAKRTMEIQAAALAQQGQNAQALQAADIQSKQSLAEMQYGEGGSSDRANQRYADIANMQYGQGGSVDRSLKNASNINDATNDRYGQIYEMQYGKGGSSDRALQMHRDVAAAGEEGTNTRFGETNKLERDKMKAMADAAETKSDPSAKYAQIAGNLTHSYIQGNPGMSPEQTLDFYQKALTRVSGSDETAKGPAKVPDYQSSIMAGTTDRQPNPITLNPATNKFVDTTTGPAQPIVPAVPTTEPIDPNINFNSSMTQRQPLGRDVRDLGVSLYDKYRSINRRGQARADLINNLNQ